MILLIVVVTTRPPLVAPFTKRSSSMIRVPYEAGHILAIWSWDPRVESQEGMCPTIFFRTTALLNAGSLG